ncbi:MAG: pentapeptide repeat-containing protein [Flavobacterium sp.]|nr:MAG: pentapeptide repeat-containing protein [Flavobacterium sp.]
MNDFINIDRTFEKIIRNDAKIGGREFDGCIFKNCDFSNSVFSECVFIDCEFSDCNLSNVKLPATGLKTVSFKNSKLLGIRFDECEDFLFNVSFQQSALDYSWFINKKMQKTAFSGSSLKGVNFSGCDLTSADFSGSDLDGAIFENTILKSADFTTAYNYKIDPELNPMPKAKFSVSGIPGLLEKYNIRIE